MSDFRCVLTVLFFVVLGVLIPPLGLMLMLWVLLATILNDGRG